MKISQKQLAFYKLYKSYKSDPNEYVNIWDFVGEIYIEEINEWHLMSYKCPTRLTDLYQENLMIIDRRKTTGKSGAEYYQYRLYQPSRDKIETASVRVFYDKIRYQADKKKLLNNIK